ncbi:MAG: pseudouridine synthase [Desulfofustis sp.]|jgi:23S rRNA pseudouridine2605 synthase|nr:pseudouridine synthase [Desulfofustis sp.]
MALTTTVRLHKYLAQCGVASRRAAEELIRDGQVSVDGRVVTEMGCKIDPGRQRIHCRGKLVRAGDTGLIYILLNKPAGYVTTMADPQGRPIVTSLLKDVTTRVFPVGRLDLDTEGALLLTNDGQLAHRVLHPSHQTTKTYEALIQGHPASQSLAELERGILLEGQRTWPAVIKLRKRYQHSTRIRITIHEGRKRQVRKMFGAVGHPVLHLKRIAYGKLQLGSLPTGGYRMLDENDLKKIFL